jgi:ribosomal RNA-processing protein 17
MACLRQMREQRKADLQTHLKEFNAELRKQNPDLPSESEDEDDAEEATFEGFGAVDDIDGQEDEYVDEDKYTTVTVEAMDGSDDEADKEAYVPKPEDDPTAFAKPKKRPMTKDGKLKQKKRNFRYETKAERKVTRDKQKKRNNKEASARREANEAKEKTAKSRKGKK